MFFLCVVFNLKCFGKQGFETIKGLSNWILRIAKTYSCSYFITDLSFICYYFTKTFKILTEYELYITTL
jgi:hypothetical protein